MFKWLPNIPRIKQLEMQALGESSPGQFLLCGVFTGIGNEEMVKALALGDIDANEAKRLYNLTKEMASLYPPELREKIQEVTTNQLRLITNYFKQGIDRDQVMALAEKDENILFSGEFLSAVVDFVLLFKR